MCKTVFISALFFLYAFHLVQAEDGPIIEIPNGKIRGVHRENFYEFKSIPYAEPPTGERKLEPPQPYTSKWEGIRDSTSMPSPCLQWDEFYPGLIHGAEDCLYLNIFTPNIGGNKTYPVIIHIHGGAFMFGSSQLYGPEFLLKERNLILVTLNYRLGPLGFLSTGDNQISGNMGLKDQQLAIKWVNNNIHIFKGNPKNITISGFSAGGASVHLHLLAKESQQLFSAAISHSGTAFCAWVLTYNPLTKAKILAEHLKCPMNSTKAIKDCLKYKDSKEIVQAVKHFQPYMYNPFTVFGPVIESPNSENAFLTDDLETIIKEGNTANVPWIISFTNEEGGYNGAKLMLRDENRNELIEQLNDNWFEVAPYMLFYNEIVSAHNYSTHAKEIKDQYLGNEKFSSKTYRQFQKLLTDHLYLFGIEKSLKLHTEFSNAPVYIYRYNSSLSNGAASLMSNRTDFDFGTVHGDDVYLIFNCTLLLSEKTEKEYEMSKSLVELYESIAETGKPKFRDIYLPENTGLLKDFKILGINGIDSYEIENIERIT